MNLAEQYTRMVHNKARNFYGQRGSLSCEAPEGATKLHVVGVFGGGWAFFDGMLLDCRHKGEQLLRVKVKKSNFDLSTLELEEPLPDDLGNGTELYRHIIQTEEQ